MCAQLYIQKAAQPDTWVMSGSPSATAIWLSRDTPINYSDGSTDTLPANTPAAITGGGVSFDRTHDVYVPYTVKGSGVLSIIKESLLPTLTDDYAPLSRVELHGIKPYQPEPYLASGSLGGTVPLSSSTPLVSDTSAKALSLWNGSANNSPPASWYTSGFDDSAWSAAVVATVGIGFTWPAGSSIIWPTATPVSTTEAALFRQHVTLPDVTIASASVLLSVDDGVTAVYVNGTALTLGSSSYSYNTGPAIDVPVGLLVAGGDNVLAVQAFNTLPSHAWVGYSLSIASTPRGASTAHEGDLLYYHDGQWTDLPIGTSGQELTVVAGDPAWATPSASGVTSIDVAVPAPLSSSGGPITASGTITLAWASGQTANRVLAAPDGTTGAVSLRALVAADIPSLPASQITSGHLAGARGGTGLDASAVTDGQLLIGQTSDHTFGLATLTAGSGVTITNAGHGITIAASGGSGTVTSVTLTVPGFLSVSGSPITTSGTLAISLATQSAATVFAGPTSGSAAAPTFRALQGSDLPPAAAAGGHIHAHGHFL